MRERSRHVRPSAYQPCGVFTHGGFSPRIALPNDDYYDVIISPLGNSPHPTPLDNVEQSPNQGPFLPRNPTRSSPVTRTFQHSNPHITHRRSRFIKNRPLHYALRPKPPQCAPMSDAGSQGSRISTNSTTVDLLQHTNTRSLSNSLVFRTVGRAPRRLRRAWAS